MRELFIASIAASNVARLPNGSFNNPLNKEISS
jgi:hypothetical protein